MRLTLLGLGWGVPILGIVCGAAAFGLGAGDPKFTEIAAAYARHPDNLLFQAQYGAAALRHYGLLTVAVLAPLVGIVAGVGLLGVAEVLRRLPRQDGGAR